MAAPLEPIARLVLQSSAESEAVQRNYSGSIFIRRAKMKHQSMANESRRELGQLEISTYGNDLVAEPAMSISDLWTHPLRQRARIRSDERLHLHSRRKNISWFLGLYMTSLLSMSGMISGVRWMLAFL
jgi:hypothetical protein